MTLRIEPTSDGVVIHVKVVPNSSRDQLAGPLGHALKVKVAAPPEAGKANKAVCRLIADALGLPPASVTIVSGESNPNKRVALKGVTHSAVRRGLA